MSQPQPKPVQQCLAIDDDVDFDTLLENLDHLEDDPRLWTKTLADLLTVIDNQLQRNPGTGSDTAKVARDITAAIAHYLGGRRIYLPRDSRLQRALRDHNIFEQAKGFDHQELADQHGLTAAQVYNILARQKKIRLAQQPKLDL